jgi:hypothetical protein
VIKQDSGYAQIYLLFNFILFRFVKMNTYNNFITFLKGLEEGLEIEIDGYVYVVAYDSTNKPRITHKVETLNTKTGEKGFAYMQGMDAIYAVKIA